MGAIIGAVANPIVWLLLAVAVGIGAASGYFKGRADVNAAWNLERAEIAAGAAEDARHRAVATTAVVTKYVDRIVVVTEKADEIVREVPSVVRADERVSAGFVCIHDRAGSGDPGAACAPDGEAGGAGAREVAETVARNYGRYHKLAEQVIALQDFVETVCHRQAAE